jgi:hypothetical protein
VEGGESEGLVASRLVTAGAVVGGDELEGLFELMPFGGDLDANVARQPGDAE